MRHVDGKPAIGIVLGSMQRPSEIVGAACRAEESGFEEIWVGEDYFFTGGIATAASILARTAIPVGLGIVPAVARHPGLLAMEIGTLANMYPGRLHAGIGAGVPDWLDQMALRPRSPLGSVRNTLDALRVLLAGETLSVEHATFTAREIALAHPPANVPPLYVGASGPKALQLSGERADGTVLSVLAGTAYVRWAREQVLEGGAEPGHRIVVYAFCAIDEDPSQAREMLRDVAGLYLLTGPRNPLTEVQGIADEAEQLGDLGIEAATPQIPDEWLSDLTVAGPPDECAARIRQLADAGADAVALCFPPEQPVQEMIALAAREILPRVRT